MSSSAATCDCIVVGGGVIGLATAYELLRRHRRVRVLERERPGSGASHAAAGMLAPVSEVELEGPSLLRLGLDSLSRYPDFVASLEQLTGMSCRYRTDGALWVAVRRDHLADLDHLEALLRDLDLPARRISGEAVSELEPHITGRVMGGLLVEGDHQVDPRALVACLAAAIVKLGGSIESGVRVSAIESRESGCVVAGRDASDREFQAGAAQVALCAGAWSTKDIRSAASPAGLRPVKDSSSA